MTQKNEFAVFQMKVDLYQKKSDHLMRTGDRTQVWPTDMLFIVSGVNFDRACMLHSTKNQ